MINHLYFHQFYSLDDVPKLKEILENEKQLIESLDQENLTKNKNIIATRDYFFYPIIIDTEINIKGECFLIGLFFVNTNQSVFLFLKKSSPIIYIKKLQNELNNLFTFLQKNNLKEYKKNNSKKLYPILVGHNIIKYDFILLNKVVTHTNFNTNLFDVLVNCNTLIIQGDQKKYTQELRANSFDVYKFGDKFLFLDTLNYVNPSEAKSLFRFKTEILKKKRFRFSSV